MFTDNTQKKMGECDTLPSVDINTPAVAVKARLKPARKCRWVASALLRCFQRPEPFGTVREACNPQRELGIPYNRCGFKRA